MDLTIEVAHMPKAGETILGKSVLAVPGGKGANQAYAIGKLGGDIRMVGAVGTDAYGAKLVKNLENVGVGTEAIETIDGVPSGQAFITVDESGENSIVVIPGTNLSVTRETVDRHKKAIEESDIVIMQFEIPLDTVQYVKEMAAGLGKTVIVDPAPAVSGLLDHFWDGIDYIKPNETELSILTGKPVTCREDAVLAAGEMVKKGVKNVLVTLGSEGCLLINKEREQFFPAHKVKAVDTTAAGDCFTAAFALGLGKGMSEEEAIGLAQKASSIAVTRKGAQTSIPAPEELEV